MPEPGHWPSVFADVAADYKGDFDRAVNQLLNEELPALLEKAPWQDRLALYGTIDMEALRNADPHIWQVLSADALTLQERQRKQDEQKQADLEKLQYTQGHLLRNQLQPFGVTPGTEQSATLGADVAPGLMSFR